MGEAPVSLFPPESHEPLASRPWSLDAAAAAIREIAADCEAAFESPYWPEVGRGRYSLWTGDPGTALYLALCLEGGATLPGFDDNDFV